MVFILSDGSLGKIWQVSLWETESKTEDYLSSLSVHLQNFLSRIPSENIACQMIVVSHADVAQRLEVYGSFQEAQGGSGVFKDGKIDCHL